MWRTRVTEEYGLDVPFIGAGMVLIALPPLVAAVSNAGGHNRGVAATFSLVPAVVDAIAPVPVIAAGGIADGRGVAAALALGADAVWVGTCLVASREVYAHDEYKRRILAAMEADTVRTTIFGPEWPGAQTRVLRNRVANEWAGREDEIPPFSAPPQLIGRTLVGGQEVPMPKFSVLLPTPDTTGDLEEMCLLSGESAGLVRDIRPAGEIVLGMMEEARQTVQGRLLAMAGGRSGEGQR